MTEPTCALKARIQDDMKVAMRAQAKERLSTIRLILSAVKQKEVDERVTLTDNDVLSILNKMIKQRRESVAQYESAQRADLAAKENDEIGVIQAYLPAQLDEAEIARFVSTTITEVGAKSAKDMGAVMNALRPKIQGRCDMTEVSKIVKQKLSEGAPG